MMRSSTPARRAATKHSWVSAASPFTITLRTILIAPHAHAEALGGGAQARSALPVGKKNVPRGERSDALGAETGGERLAGFAEADECERWMRHDRSPRSRTAWLDSPPGSCAAGPAR